MSRVRIKAESYFEMPEGGHDVSVHAGYAEIEREQGWKLSYQERKDGGEISIVLKATKRGIRMERTGETNGALDFIPGEETEGLYVTPFGEFVLSLRTQQAEIEENDAGGALHLRYEMLSDGAVQTRCRYTLQWKS